MTSDYVRLRHKLAKNMLALASYTILTGLLTFPVAFTLGARIPGGEDAWHHIWNLWYTKMAILAPDPNMSLTYTNYIFYPVGIPLIPFPMAFNQLLSVPLQLIFEVPIVYTILWLMTFILAGYGTYLLVKYLTNNDAAAFISGIAYAFSPYHFAQATGHMGATTIQWIPFCALYLMKGFKEGTLRNAIYAGIFFILVSMGDLQYMVFMGVFAGVLLVYEMWCVARGKLSVPVFFILKRYLTFACVSILGVLPFTYTMILRQVFSENTLAPRPDEVIRNSADLLGFFIPSHLNPFFAEIVGPVYSNFSSRAGEITTFIGYTLLSTFLISFCKLRKRIYVRFWLTTAVIFTTISLGPILHINGVTRFTVFDATIPLPYLVLHSLTPFLELSRTPSRFFVLATLSFAVLLGYSLLYLLKRSTRKKKVLLIAVLTFLLLFEFSAVPFPTSPVERPSFYRTIGADDETYALFEVFSSRIDDMRYNGIMKAQYYQTIHRKPMIGGEYPRVPAATLKFEENTPLIREFLPLWRRRYSGDILNQNPREIAESILSYYNIRYVIVHTEYLTEDEVRSANSLLRSTLGMDSTTYEEDGLVVYNVSGRGAVRQFMTLCENWWRLESINGVLVRWISNNATVLVYSPVDKEAILRFQVSSFYRPRTLQVYLNEELVREQEVLGGFKFAEVMMRVNLRRGMNIIRFYSLDGCERPCDVFGLSSSDTRCLSFAFTDITVDEAWASETRTCWAQVVFGHILSTGRGNRQELTVFYED